MIPNSSINNKLLTRNYLKEIIYWEQGRRLKIIFVLVKWNIFIKSEGEYLYISLEFYTIANSISLLV